MAPSTASIDQLVLDFETFLFDADGVLWTGDRPVPGAIDLISRLLHENKRVFILTNNSTKTHDQYMEKLKRIGYDRLPAENVISAAMVIADYVKDEESYQGREVFLLGTKNLQKTLEAAGVRTARLKFFEPQFQCVGVGPDHMTDYGEQDILHSVPLEHNPRAVICSYDSHFSYPKLMKAANYLSRPDVDFLITNEDYTFPGPRPEFVIPGAGYVGAAVRVVTGRIPTVFGKPGKPMADFLTKKHHIDPARTIMFGDRLDTDIHFANSNGFASCLVLTGVHSLEDVGKAELEGRMELIPQFTSAFV